MALIIGRGVVGVSTNIPNVTSHWSIFPGRLLRANQIIFNWDRLASWINLTEEWPYRTSWLILFLEETDGISDQVPLKTIYERYAHTHLHSNKHACTGRRTHKQTGTQADTHFLDSFRKVIFAPHTRTPQIIEDE